MGAVLLKPFAAPIKHNNRQHVRLLLSTDDGKAKTCPPRFEVGVVESADLVKNEEALTRGSCCSKVSHRLVQAMDLELLKDAKFLSIIIGMALVYTSTMQFTMLFPQFLQVRYNILSL